jgi:hypothetical protein
MTTNFFSPLSFVAVFGSGIRDPRSGIRDPGWVKIRIRDPGSGLSIPDQQHWPIRNSFFPDTAGSGSGISGSGSQTYIFESILKIYSVKTNNFLNIGPNICQHFKNNIGTAACTG